MPVSVSVRKKQVAGDEGVWRTGERSFSRLRSEIEDDNDYEDDYDFRTRGRGGLRGVSFVADRDLDNAGPRASDGS